MEGFSHKLGLLTLTIFQRLAALHTQVPPWACPGHGCLMCGGGRHGTSGLLCRLARTVSTLLQSALARCTFTANMQGVELCGVWEMCHVAPTVPTPFTFSPPS